VLVMDEPTSSLTSREVTQLFALIQRLAARGVAIVYITHRLDEVFRIGRRITVMRDGRHVTTRPIDQVSVPELVRLMANRDLNEHFPKVRAERGAELMRADGLTVRGNVVRVIDVRLERGLHGARLREALIRAGCVVPAGWAKHEIFETDTRGRQEAAETIAFEEREIASHVEADNDDPEVCTKLVSLLQLDDGSRRILYDRRAKRLRAWRELFPYSRDDDRGWA
jgi:ABC-type sugar transport system ATPase subunit